MLNMDKLGIIAGNGTMPQEVIAHCKSTNRDFFMVGLEPYVLPETLHDTPHISAKIGEIGRIFKHFHLNGVIEIVFAGGIQRPSLKELIPDLEGLKLMTKLAIKRMSDDNVFRILINEIEARDYKVVGAHEVMPHVLFEQGSYGSVKPSKSDMADIQKGVKVAKTMGELDVGQSCVVQEGIILAVEAREGTDNMIDRVAALKRTGRPPILVKIKKPGQDMRVDLPTIGPKTMEYLIKNGVKGLAVEAGSTIFLEKEKVLKMANEAKIFIFCSDFE